MNSLIASESIDYQYNYYKQALYRRYKRDGIDGAIAFLAVILQENPLIFRILKKQYRFRMSDEQSADLNRRFEEVLSRHNDTDDAATLALYTMAALYDRNNQAGNIVKHAGILSDKNKDFILKYNQEAARLQELSFLNPMDSVQFLLYKYIHYSRRAMYDDVYNNYQPIIINPALKNNPLKQLFTKRIEDSEFKYLDFLINSLQNTTLEAAGVDEETLFNAGQNLETSQYTHYVTFCISMFLRKSEDPVTQLKDLEYCCDRLKNVLKGINKKSVYYVDYLKMLHSILLDQGNTLQYIDGYQYKELDYRDRHDSANRKWIEDVFEILFADYPELVLPFIEKLAENNAFAFDKNRDYEFARRRSMVLCRDWVIRLKEHYTVKQCIDIFMNSPLRSCYPITLFLKNLLLREEKEVEIKNDEEYYHGALKKLFNKYVFTGIIYTPKNHTGNELTAYSFRNDNCLISLPKALMKSAESLHFNREKVKGKTVWVSEPVRFKLKSIHFINNEGEIHKLVAYMPEDYKANRFKTSRNFSAYI